MSNQTNNDRSLELVASTREQRQAISRVVSAIKASENMSFNDIFRDLRPIFPPAYWRIRRFVFDLMRPVFAMPFSWQIRWA